MKMNLKDLRKTKAVKKQLAMILKSLRGTKQRMTFKQALKKLNIEDYGERIFNSNSHGELIHLMDYIQMAQNIKGHGKEFRTLFEICVEYTKENWSRPESCYQHMPRLMHDFAKALASTAKL